MRLKKLVFFEVLSSIAVLLTILVVLEVLPYLQPSEQNSSIGLYNAKSFPKNNITLASGGYVNAPFYYSSYDPAIIIIELSFLTCEKPGYLVVYCNYRVVASVFVHPETPPVVLNLFSVSGLDWFEPPSAMFGANELLFESESKNGYAGKLTYQITLRGSR